MGVLSILDEMLVLLLARPRLLGEAFTPEQKALIEKYKTSIARALGVPTEAIREDVAERWLTHWLKALVKPEYWKTLGIE